MSSRDSIEEKLIKLFPGQLKTLDESCIADINTHKNGDYGFSYLGLSLYANGHNIHSQSTHFKRGLIYKDNDAIFGVGVFFRPQKPETPAIHIIAPRGENWVQAVDHFTQKLLQEIPNAELFVRHLSFEQYRALKPQTNLDRILERPPESLWTAAEANPWVKKKSGPDEIWATQEDETFNGRRVRLVTEAQDQDRIESLLPPLTKTNEKLRALDDTLEKEKQTNASEERLEALKKDIIALVRQRGPIIEELQDKMGVITAPEQGMFTNIPWLYSGNERNMKRRNYNGFQNFLEKNDLEFVLEQYTPAMETDARGLIRAHFDHLKDKAIGSTAADYENVISCDPKQIKAAGVHMYVGFLKKKNDDSSVKIPVSFFGLEDIAKNTVGGYATISCYDEARVLPLMMISDDDKKHALRLLPLLHMSKDEKTSRLASMDAEEQDRFKRLEEAFKGFHNIATYAMGQVMHTMKNQGMHWFDLGGSETHDLDIGKRRLGATELRTSWAVSQQRQNATSSDTLGVQ